MIYKNNGNELNITRYPKSTNKSLIAWNSADEYVLKYIGENKINTKDVIIYNDRFGFLSSFLIDFTPKSIIENKSQEKAIKINFDINKLSKTKCEFINPLDKLNESINFSIIKIPKSMELFRLYLQHLSEALNENSIVLCGFMTKYFTHQMLDIANEYFDEVKQSLAWKKSRLLILRKAKPAKSISIIKEIILNEKISVKQYFGVFSGNNIDYATQFLIENINLKETDNKILDLGSGNGIIALTVNEKKDDCEIYLVDDSFLAVESSKFNLKGENIHFLYSDNLEEYEENYFDFVVSNPPFHFEQETNIEIATTLFNEAVRCLKPSGHFQVVANKHLNYKTHLVKLFGTVEIAAENDKFVIYDCSN